MFGRINRWLPAGVGKDNFALWHVLHDDGDEEDLEVATGSGSGLGSVDNRFHADIDEEKHQGQRASCFSEGICHTAGQYAANGIHVFPLRCTRCKLHSNCTKNQRQAARHILDLNTLCHTARTVLHAAALLATTTLLPLTLIIVIMCGWGF